LGIRNFIISGLMPGENYALSSGERIASDERGTLRFYAATGKPLEILRVKTVASNHIPQ
jgi:hypothetical protein